MILMDIDHNCLVREDGVRFGMHESHPDSVRCENCLALLPPENVSNHVCEEWWQLDMFTFDMRSYLDCNTDKHGVA